MPELEEWIERSGGRLRAEVAHRRLIALVIGSGRTTRRTVRAVEVEVALAAGRVRVHRHWVTEPGMWLQYDRRSRAGDRRLHRGAVLRVAGMVAVPLLGAGGAPAPTTPAFSGVAFPAVKGNGGWSARGRVPAAPALPADLEPRCAGCPECEQRYLNEALPGLSAVLLPHRPGRLCPHCAEPVALSDLHVRRGTSLPTS